MSDLIKTTIIAGGFALGSILLAFIARWILRVVLGAVYRTTKSELDDRIFKCLESPLILAVIAAGLYGSTLAVLHSEVWKFEPTRLADYITRTNQIYKGIFTLIVAFGLLRVVNAVARWYATSAAPASAAYQIELLKKLTNIAVWALVVVLVLGQLGYKVSALLATLGVGGLAVALALQDTLANIFAGFYVMADKSVKVGDYVKLDSGDEGFVEEVGWRNTRIRLWANNMVLIPNSKLIQSVVTNYNMPHQELSVYVSCGVSYNSDLDHVERVTIETANQILQEVPGAVSDYQAAVRFKEFGDSNINFVVVLRAKDIASQYLIHHEFIKALHRRYREEGIEISYPVRVIVPSGDISGAVPL
ncbi:MAG TPA: mechanosensitive ion channel family protein [Armatimonadota bacterium]|nr:mechanosensitive ion channel family protein [Armatimonadota bacterium]